MKDALQHHATGEVHQARPLSQAGLIIRQKEPTNLEMAFDELDSFLTPAERFYIRSHFPAPWLEAAAYRLHIDGAVSRPFSLTYQELRDLLSETRWPPWSALSPARLAGARRPGRGRLRGRAGRRRSGNPE
jgi:DMSO/TMAO reductase YedYZ molybdopterin-dependent catalytic subunit